MLHYCNSRFFFNILKFFFLVFSHAAILDLVPNLDENRKQLADLDCLSQLYALQDKIDQKSEQTSRKQLTDKEQPLNPLKWETLLQQLLAIMASQHDLLMRQIFLYFCYYHSFRVNIIKRKSSSLLFYTALTVHKIDKALPWLICLADNTLVFNFQDL